MNSAEFKMIRRLLGITTDEVAKACNVNLRTSRRWESTHWPPADAVEWLQSKLAHARTTVNTMLTQFQAEADTSDSDYSPVLPLYKTDEAAQRALGTEMTKEQHAAIMGMVAFLGDDLDIRAEFVDEEPHA
jgi:transcriptional regulator with XRE-family HTH domain